MAICAIAGFPDFPYRLTSRPLLTQRPEEYLVKAHVKGYQRFEQPIPGGRGIMVQLTWQPGDITPLHNHRSGNGKPLQGIVYVLQGDLFEIAKDGTVTHHLEGEQFFEIPDGYAHVVGNNCGRVARSVHFYFPSLAMDVFDYPGEVRTALHTLGIEL